MAFVRANHGVNARYVNDLKDGGFTKLNASDVMDARNHGVTAQDVRDAKKYGASMSVRQIVRLKQAGAL